MFLIRTAILVSLVASAYGVCPTTPVGGHSICGENKCVSIPNALIIVPNFPPISCSKLQKDAYGGNLDHTGNCLFHMYDLIDSTCECTSDGLPTLHPKPTPKPTRKPTPKPTPKPTTKRLPTKRPTSRVPTYKPNTSIP